MALSANRLATAIKEDTSITANIPAAAISTFNNFADKIAQHIVEEFNNHAVVDDVTVNADTGVQNNEASVK